jgi:hypothetical protein
MMTSKMTLKGTVYNFNARTEKMATLSILDGYSKKDKDGNYSKKDKDGNYHNLFHNALCFGYTKKKIAALGEKCEIVVIGHWEGNKWTNKEGREVTTPQLVIDELLSWKTADQVQADYDNSKSRQAPKADNYDDLGI